MDDCTHQPTPNPELASPVPVVPPAAAALQEATGDSESDAPVSAATAAGDRPAGYAEDDAESCSGAGGDGSRAPAASVVVDDVAGEGDESEVDSRMAVPWWRRTTVHDAMDGAGGACARTQATAEGGAAAVVAGASHAAESNRLFWEACIAHGY